MQGAYFYAKTARQPSKLDFVRFDGKGGREHIETFTGLSKRDARNLATQNGFKPWNF